jgi:mycofactocin system creatininase family protein
MMEQKLRSTTWPTVPGGSTVLVPVGSIEQHGPHLPLDTDSVIATAVAEGAAARLLDAHPHAGRFLVAPTVTYGASGEHQSFAGTTSIGTDVLRLVVVELVRSMRTWAARVVLVNGHGGNVPALEAAVTQLRHEGHDVGWVPCRTETVDLHAGYTETSLMLHLDRARVRLELAVAGNTRSLAALLPAMMQGGVGAVSVNGVLGDPAGASIEEGQRVLRAMVDEVTSAVLEGTLVPR